MKILPPAIVTQLETGRLSVRYMLHIDMPSGPVGLWSGDAPLLYAGTIYTPLAGAMRVAEIPASAGLSVDQMEVTVTGFTAAITPIMASTDWHQRACVVSRAYLDDTGAVAFVEPLFAGKLDQAPITSADGQAYTVTAILESNSRELDRANGRTRSHADQLNIDSTDLFYSYTAAVTATKEITWGRAGPKSPF